MTIYSGEVVGLIGPSGWGKVPCSNALARSLSQRQVLLPWAGRRPLTMAGALKICAPCDATALDSFFRRPI